MYLVYEFCEGGTLDDIIRAKKFLPEQEALKVFNFIIPYMLYNIWETHLIFYYALDIFINKCNYT